MTDHYKILGVAPSADSEVIHAAYKAMMRKYHPDTNSGEDSSTRAAEINAAFSILGDNEKRNAYDKSLKNKNEIYIKTPLRKDEDLTGMSEYGNGNNKFIEALISILSILSILFIKSLIYIFMLPGRIFSEIYYLYPKKGQIMASGRRRNHPFIHVFYSSVFYAIVMLIVMASHGSKQGSDIDEGHPEISTGSLDEPMPAIKRPHVLKRVEQDREASIANSLTNDKNDAAIAEFNAASATEDAPSEVYDPTSSTSCSGAVSDNCQK